MSIRGGCRERFAQLLLRARPSIALPRSDGVVVVPAATPGADGLWPLHLWAPNPRFSTGTLRTPLQLPRPFAGRGIPARLQLRSDLVLSEGNYGCSAWQSS